MHRAMLDLHQYWEFNVFGIYNFRKPGNPGNFIPTRWD
jgi:hypothetical protein